MVELYFHSHLCLRGIRTETTLPFFAFSTDTLCNLVSLAAIPMLYVYNKPENTPKRNEFVPSSFCVYLQIYADYQRNW
jgi:hypothetical protein